MKTSRILIIVLSSLLTLYGCKSRSGDRSGKTNSKPETIDMHSSRTSVDWAGTYLGKLPCASCPGIYTIIRLNEDETYEKTVEYLESDDVPETTTGKFQWDESGSNITIGENVYKVGENQLFVLDSENKIVAGNLAEYYILKKIMLPPFENDDYTQQVFAGNDNKEYKIIFNTNPKIPQAYVESGGMKKLLEQTESHATGAEYAGNKIKLTVQGETGTLMVDGKEIELTEKK